MSQSSPDPPDEAFTCDSCGRAERIPASYLLDVISRNREWFMQQLHTADNFSRPGRRLMFKGRVGEDGKVIATVEKRVGSDGESQE